MPISAAVASGLGFYSRPAFAMLATGTLLVLLACLLRERVWRPSGRLAWLARPEVILAVWMLLLSGGAVFVTDVYYNDAPAFAPVLRTAAVVGFVLGLSLVPDVVRGDERMSNPLWRLVLLFVAGAVLRGAALFASPDPLIDVHAWLRDASQHTLQGENPYAAEYDNVYASDRARSQGWSPELPPRHRIPAYPPHPVLVALPFRATGLDVRWANVVCDLLAAAVLYWTGASRRRPLLGALAAAACLNLPRVPFLIEQAWYEPLLAVSIGGGLLLIERGWRGGHVLLAFGLTGKQFGLALLPPLWRALRRQTGWLLLGIALVLAVVFLPFFLWGPADFVDIVLLSHLRNRPVDCALTIHSAVLDLCGEPLPRPVLWLTAGGLIALITWRTPGAGVGSALWAGASLLVFCLFHQTGFFNYYHLCVYLILLGSTALLADPPYTDADGRRIACQEVEDGR